MQLCLQAQEIVSRGVMVTGRGPAELGQVRCLARLCWRRDGMLPGVHQVRASISARSNPGRRGVVVAAHAHTPPALLVSVVDVGGSLLRMGRLAVVVLVHIVRAIWLYRRRARVERLLLGEGGEMVSL